MMKRGTLLTAPVLVGGGAALIAALPASLPMAVGFAGVAGWEGFAKLREFWADLHLLHFRGSFGYYNYGYTRHKK
ncbi:MAG: hypothetical protein JNM12_14815 [Alphaproteobacteria bacterium]|nr:hypothetical protein [Alphaproteobacteria bacterium]